MPTSMPTIRATTTSADDSPCTLGSVCARTAALTGASARPKPNPQTTSAMLEDGSSRLSMPHRDIRKKPVADIAIPTAVTGPGAAGPHEVAADDRADRQRDEEADQHQGSHQLGGAVRRRPGVDRDVDQCRDQRRADEEAHQDRAPRRRLAERAGRNQRCLGAAQVRHERRAGDRGDEQVPEAAVGEDLDLRVGGREREDHAAEGDREEQGSPQVGLARGARPAGQVQQAAGSRWPSGPGRAGTPRSRRRRPA